MGALIAVVVTALPAQGFFRCGQYWPPAPTPAEVDQATLERLEAERMLQVRLAGDEDKPKAKTKAAGEPQGGGEPSPSGQQPQGDAGKKAEPKTKAAPAAKAKAGQKAAGEPKATGEQKPADGQTPDGGAGDGGQQQEA